MRIGIIGLVCVLIIGCEQERVIDNEQLQIRNEVAYEVNSSDPFTGKVFSTYPNGLKKREVTFVNGLKEGVETIWHENGQKTSEGPYVNGTAEGTHTNWDEHGQKEIEGTVVNGKLAGTVISYAENGTVKDTECYKNDEVISEGKCP